MQATTAPPSGLWLISDPISDLISGNYTDAILFEIQANKERAGGFLKFLSTFNFETVKQQQR